MKKAKSSNAKRVKMRRKRSENRFIFWLLIIALGGLAGMSGIGAFTNQIGLRENGFETTATVTELRETRRRVGRTATTRGSVFVQYEVGGAIYTNRLNIEFRQAYIGEELRIYYDPSNPARITPADRSRATDSPGRFIVLFSFSALLISLGIVSIIKLKRQQNKASFSPAGGQSGGC
ncbi:MAG: DUF3592 domain-containing protein [Spirochaetes bacterium]|nr:DUF3592 domain-containing protein [Spirochaetota bacterium]